MIFLYDRLSQWGLGEIGGYNYMPYIQSKSEKATFLSQKNPFILFSFIPQLHTAKNVIKEQTIYRYYIEILKKEYDTEKAS